MSNSGIFGGDILIDNGKILKIEKNIPIEGDANVIDCSGKNVLPGFIEAHSHIGIGEDGIGWEGLDYNEMSDPATPHMRAIDAINPDDYAFKEARMGGVTTCVTGPGSANVLGGSFVAVKTYGSIVEDMLLKNPVAIKCAFGENPKRVYTEEKKAPMTRMGTAAILREYLYKAKEYMGKIEDASEAKDMPPFDIKLDSLIPVLKKELPLKVHAHRADDIATAIRIAKEFDINITLDHCTEGHLIKDYIKKEGLSAIVGPTLSSRSKIELKNMTFETPKILNEAGIRIALTTDHDVIPVHYLPVCAALAVRHGMDEMEALKAITINPAIITGIDENVGSIEEGKDADIIIMEGHPLDFRTSIETTIINGKVVYSC